MSDDTCSATRSAIAQLRELLEEKIHSLDAITSARLDAMDKALELAHSKDYLGDLGKRFEDMVERLAKLEKDKARRGSID